MTRRAHPSGSAYFRPAGSLLTPRRELTAAERADHAELLRQFRDLLEPFRSPSLTA